MRLLTYSWLDPAADRPPSPRHSFDLALVEGTGAAEAGPYPFGDRASGHGGPLIEIPRSFYIGTTPVTQALWDHVMECGGGGGGGALPNPAVNPASPTHPQENVSWDSLTAPGGFLDRLNASAIRPTLAAQADHPSPPRFRLPTEAEWEYAARGGPHWGDGYHFSGGDDIDAVAWYGRRHGDHTQPVSQKAPNQLGIYDMSGNVWEWCQDIYHPDPACVPADGSAYSGSGAQRVLRGGCFHNWAVHCTVSKRYEIDSDAHDGCIGLRLVFAS